MRHFDFSVWESIGSGALLLLGPEYVLALAAMGLLMLGVFRGEGPGRMHLYHRLAALAVAPALALLWIPIWHRATAVGLFDGALVVDDFARYMKTLILLGALAAVAMSAATVFSLPRKAPAGERVGLERFEYPVLILLATLGMCLMVSAADLIALYLSLELQGLCLYALAASASAPCGRSAFARASARSVPRPKDSARQAPPGQPAGRRVSARSSEAGLKYFVLGALSSGLLLYGCSLLYGFAGGVSFVSVAEAAAAAPGHPGLIFGMVFVLAGLAFKLSAAPFHMWTPDVYEGAPTPVTAFLAGAGKLAAVALLLRFVAEGLMPMAEAWRQVVIALAVASMVLGALAAIGQRNVKRLMAYSAIGHVGYMLAALAAGVSVGASAILLYLALYLSMNIGVFCAILMMRRADGMVEDIADLAGLHGRQPFAAFLLAVLLFSLAGVPPLAGFFAKFQVFLAVVEAGLYPLAVLGVLTSVVAAFYYLRVVRVMYFDEAGEGFELPAPGVLMGLLVVAGLVNLLFVVYPGGLVRAADWAAAALFVVGG